MNDAWSTGTAYEAYMGRWSRHLAPRFVSWLGVRSGRHWLDVGCGTGALSEAICDGANPASVTACDPSGEFVEFARRNRADSRIAFVVAAAGGLPTRPGGFDTVTSAFALNFVSDPAAAIREFRGVTAGGGLVSACVWDYAGRMDFLRRFWDAAADLDPEAAALDEGRRFPMCRPDALEALFEDAGLVEVVCEPIEIATRFADFASFWTPFLGGTGPAPTYVAGLEPGSREALAAHLDRSLPREPDGAISLDARAWAVRGKVSRP